MVDEVKYDDADYIYGSVADQELNLSRLDDPLVSSGHRLHVRMRCPTGLGWMTISLMQGATTIVSASWTGIVTTLYDDYFIDLTPAEADAITDYSLLRVKLSTSTGGAIRVSQADLMVSGTVRRMAVTGNAPSVSSPDNRTPATLLGALALTGNTPTASVGVNRWVWRDQLLITGNAPSVQMQHFASPGSTAVSLSANAASMLEQHAFLPSADALSIGGLAPAAAYAVNHVCSPVVGALQISGSSAGLLTDVPFAPGVGNIAISSSAPVPLNGTDLVITGYPPAMAGKLAYYLIAEKSVYPAVEAPITVENAVDGDTKIITGW